MEYDGDLLTIDEIIARAELEPGLFDIYVEGEGDASVFRAILDELDLEVSVFPVKSRLQMRREEVADFSPDYGNRSVLIAAAARVHGEMPHDQRALTFVVDSDWASVTGPAPRLDSALIMSDLPSIEHYFLEEEPFRRFLTLAVLRPDADTREVREKLRGALRDIAAARITLESEDVACIEKITSLCNLQSTPTSADSAELVRRSIGRVPRADRSRSIELLPTFVAGYRQLIEDSGHEGRGHDIAPLLIVVLGLSGHFADVEVIESLMRASALPAELVDHQFFQNVVDRVRPAA